MIAALRRRHRVLSLALAPIAVIGFGLALADRTEIPRQERIGHHPVFAWLSGLSEIQGATWSVPGLETWADAGDSWQSVWIGHGSSPALALLQAPDLLLYWSPTEGLDDAELVGPLPSFPLSQRLPEQARTSDGHLLLYSLAHDEIVATATLPAVGD